MGLSGYVPIAESESEVLLDSGQHPSPSRESGEEWLDIYLTPEGEVCSDRAGQSRRHPGEEPLYDFGSNDRLGMTPHELTANLCLVHNAQAKRPSLLSTSMRWLITIFRSIFTWFTGALVTILGAIAVMIIAALNDTSPLIDKVIRGWSRAWLIASGTRMNVAGQEHVDPTRSYIVVANHESALDIMACFLAVRLPIRYLAKKELFRVPILAQGMRAVGIIEVDREARGAIHAQVNRQAQQLLEKSRSLIIFAEGTRPRDGIMRPFKKGAFTMAIAGELPVLPVSIHGAYQAMPPGTPWVRGGLIEVIIDAPVETTGMTSANTGALRDRVYETIAGRVRAMGGAVG
jgi:1-acyl-sn-glycerol-3-phosphate acyltransferase